MDAERCRRFLLRLLTVLTVAGLALLAAWVTVRWLLPFLLALITAMVLQRPLGWITRKTGIQRGFLSFILVLLIVLLLGTAAVTLLWQAGSAVVRLVSDGDTLSRLQAWVTQITERTQAIFTQWMPDGSVLADTLITRLSDAAITLLSDGFASVAAGVGEWTVGGLPSFLFDFLIWILASIFLTVDYRQITAALRRYLPPRVYSVLDAVRRHGSGAVGKLCRAYLLLMLVTFAELTVGFWLLRIPHAPLLAALIALVDILPVLGVGTVLLPWGVWLLLTGHTVSAIGTLVLYAVITVVRNLLEPRIVGRQVGLPPLATLLCMYVGLQAAGLVGLFAAPLLCVVTVRLYREGILPPLRPKTE